MLDTLVRWTLWVRRSRQSPAEDAVYEAFKKFVGKLIAEAAKEASKGHKFPKGSKSTIFKDSGPKIYTLVWFLEPGFSNTGYLGPSGVCFSALRFWEGLWKWSIMGAVRVPSKASEVFLSQQKNFDCFWLPHLVIVKKHFEHIILWCW